MMDTVKRQPAYKVWLKDVINNELIRQQGEWEPNYVKVKDLQISRVNIIGTVVFSHINEDNNFCSLTLDDGSSTIRIKAWRDDINMVNKFEIGDIVNVIGKIKEYNGEIYLSPEIVSRLEDPNWELLRKLELLSNYGKPISVESDREYSEEDKLITKEIIIEDYHGSETQTDRQKIINLIENLTTDEGAETEAVLAKSPLDKDRTQKIIVNLIKEGEIYESKPGRVKIL